MTAKSKASQSPARATLTVPPRDSSHPPAPTTSTVPQPARPRLIAKTKIQRAQPYDLGLMLTEGYPAHWRKGYGWRVTSKTPPTVPAPATGAGWRIEYELRPSSPEVYDDSHFFNPVPILHARNIVVAQRAALLVYAAEGVLENCVPHAFAAGFDPYCANPLDASELTLVEPRLRARVEQQKTICADGFEHACRLAAKASKDKSAQYALLKLLFSYSDCSFHHMELHPSKGTGGLTQSYSVSDHVLWARAIVGAFSAIEELGLDVRACNKEPSLLEGKWNPKVLEDLRRRLQESQIDPDGTLIWAVRGSRRILACKAADRFLVMDRAPWAKGPVVRDVSVNLVDAINVASWLRSNVSAHRNTMFRRRLSPIDVHNVQAIARRLLLERFGELPPAGQLPVRRRVRRLSRRIPDGWAPAPPLPRCSRGKRSASRKL